MAFKTQRDVDRLTLPAGKSEAFFFDGRVPGLSVRLQRTGAATFAVWYTAGGKRKRMSLGPVAGISLEDARRRAAEIQGAARAGRNPAQERELARAAAAEVLTLADLIGAYIEHHAERRHRPRTMVETKRYLNGIWSPLGASPAADVSRRAVSARLLEVASERGPVAANRARSKLSGAYAWAIRAGLVDVNPVVGTVQSEERSRERVLSPAELVAIWHATGDGSAYGRIVRLLLLLGVRRDEAGGMRWDELSDGVWTIPGSRTKNGRELELALPPLAVDLIEAQRDQDTNLYLDAPFVFGRAGRAPFSGWSRCKARLDERLAEQTGAPMAPWTLHDLRRSFVTHCAEQGLAQPHAIEACVNHVSGHRAGVAGIYNKATYRNEKAAALKKFADWFGRQVSQIPRK